MVSFNKLGFRDKKALAASGPADWHVLGDSFSMGWGVQEQERYSSMLQSQLSTNVYNIAIPTDIQGYARLAAYAQRSGSSIENLIVGICMENDLRLYDVDPDIGGLAENLAKRPRSPNLRTWLKTHSAVYLALSHTLQKPA